MINATPFSSDPVFNLQGFDSLPLSFILQTIESIFKRDKRLANDHSVTTAQLCVAVYSLAGSKEQLNPSQFLPYPEGNDSSKPTERVGKRTAAIFLKLLDQGALPPQVISASQRYIDSITAQT